MISKTYGKEYHGKPMVLLLKMKEDGFRFITESCPVKLAEPKDIEVHDDGSVTYTQWEENELK